MSPKAPHNKDNCGGVEKVTPHFGDAACQSGQRLAHRRAHETLIAGFVSPKGRNRWVLNALLREEKYAHLAPESPHPQAIPPPPKSR